VCWTVGTTVCCIKMAEPIKIAIWGQTPNPASQMASWSCQYVWVQCIPRDGHFWGDMCQPLVTYRSANLQRALLACSPVASNHSGRVHLPQWRLVMWLFAKLLWMLVILITVELRYACFFSASDTGWLHFLDQSVVETKVWDQTLIWTVNFGLSPHQRLAQRKCY